MTSVFSMLSAGGVPLELLTPEKIDFTTGESGQIAVQCNTTDTFLIAQTKSDDVVVEGSHNPIFTSRAYLVSAGKFICEVYWALSYGLAPGPGWIWQYSFNSGVIMPEDSGASVDNSYLFTAPAIGNAVAVKLS